MMEFPPINATRVKILNNVANNHEFTGEYSPPLLSPTTRSPIGISPRDMANMFTSFEKVVVDQSKDDFKVITPGHKKTLTDLKKDRYDRKTSRIRNSNTMLTGNMIMNNLNSSVESLQNTQSRESLFKAPRGSNQSILRGKGPKNYDHLTIE